MGLEAAVSAALLDAAATVDVDAANSVALEGGADVALTTWMVW